MFLMVALALLSARPEADFQGPDVRGSDATAAAMEVEISVSLNRSDGPVVVHLLLPGEPDEIKPLTQRDDRRWGTRIELRRADWHVVFEDLGSGRMSSEASLTELGLDPTLLGVAPPAGAPEPDIVPRSPPTLLRAAAAGAAVVVIGAAVWATVRGTRPRYLRRR